MSFSSLFKFEYSIKKNIRENRLGNPEKEKIDGAIQRNWQQWGFKTVNEDRKTRHGKLKI
jgi:hypothetical protein